jgi:glycosyltransferase involved in cell wall biosynthesis
VTPVEFSRTRPARTSGSGDGVLPRAALREDESAPRKLRVLQIAYGTALYGAERCVLAIITHLDPARIETIVACILDRNTTVHPLLAEASRLGFPTLALGDAARHWTGAIRSLRQAVRGHRIDIVHSHGTRQDLVSLLATRSLECATVSTPHGWEWRGSLKVRLSDALNKGLFPFLDAVAPLSPRLADSLRLLPMARSRVRLIPNGVDLGEVQRAVPLSGLVPGQSSSEDFVIGYMGQLIPRKGVDVLLRSLRLLGDSWWCCVIIGDGPCRRALERQARTLGIQDRTRFLGFRPDRLRVLKRLDLLVLPSHREGMPRVLLEGLAAGVPCIGTRIPGITELLDDGVSGLTVPPGDPRRLADAIRRIMADKAGAERLVAGGRARVHANHSASAMARAYELLYAELSGAR